jgi:tetratricopeptide (TPR) repeat protein
MVANKILIVLLIAVASPGCDPRKLIDPFNPSKRLAKAEEEIRTAKDDYWRLRPLGEAGMACIDLGRLDQAQKYAEELLKLSDSLYPEKGDADSIHKGNLVLGRIELRHGNIENAKSYLLKAAKVGGSPVLGSFGPNMSLAKELLEKNEREIVLEYFELCGTFWKLHKKDTLQEWIDQVKDGKSPDFGANLYY